MMMHLGTNNYYPHVVQWVNKVVYNGTHDSAEVVARWQECAICKMTRW